MRTSVALFIVGEALLLAGVALWSVPAALVLAGMQCVGLGLAREAKAAKVGGHRAVNRGRGLLRLVPPLGRRAA